MAKNKPSPRQLRADEFDVLVAAYKRHDGEKRVHDAVAAETGIDTRRCRVAWQRGSKLLGHPPIRALLRARAKNAALDVAQAEERERALIREMEERDRAHVAELAAARKLREEEAAMVQGVRVNAILLQQATASMMSGIVALSEKLGVALEKMAKGTVDAKEGVALIRQAAAISRFGSEAAQNVLKMERVLGGEPVHDKPDDEKKVSLVDAEDFFVATLRAFRRARDAGVIDDVVDAKVLPPGD